MRQQTLPDHYETTRLILIPLNIQDAEFIRELVNTPGWVQFIGQRNVHSKEDAIAYIRKIIDSPAVKYWVVKLKSENTSVGVVTFMKKDYLPHHDLGFAFLPQYNKNGYAFEAAKEILTNMFKDPNHQQIVATSRQGNVSSMKLLEKLGFKFQREYLNGEDLLSVYVVSVSALG